MTCAASVCTDSSPACLAPTPTFLRPKASDWHSSTPRSTTDCSFHYSPLTDLPPHCHSDARFTSSTKVSTPTSITRLYAVLPENLSQRHGSGLPRSPRTSHTFR